MRNNMLKPARLRGKGLLQARSLRVASVRWRWFGLNETDVTLQGCHWLLSVKNGLNKRL